MVVLANKKIFGGGPYSVAGSSSLRTVGKRKWPIAEISIQKARGVVRNGKGEVQHQHTAPFMPSSFRDAYHPGGNSLNYILQSAILMGCAPIYLLGFTLMSGSSYFFSRENPVTRRPSFYSDVERALEWLRWINKRMPGRIFCDPDWAHTPVGEVFEVRRAEVAGRVQVAMQGEAMASEPVSRVSEADGEGGLQDKRRSSAEGQKSACRVASNEQGDQGAASSGVVSTPQGSSGSKAEAPLRRLPGHRQKTGILSAVRKPK